MTDPSFWARFTRTIASKQSWILPVLLGFLGCIFIGKGISRYKHRLGYDMQLLPVLVSTQEMSQGHVIEENDFSVTPIPKKYAPVGVMLASDAIKAVGHVIIRPISRGEMVLWSALDIGFAPTGPSRSVTKGYRAIAIAVDPTKSVGYAVKAGDHIDLIATITIPGDVKPTTLTLLQDVAILAVGSHFEEKLIEAYNSVSLMVLPKEVAIILHAEKYGQLSLALRHPEDHNTQEDLPMVAMPQIAQTAFRSSLQEYRNNIVEIIRGGKRSIEKSLP